MKRRNRKKRQARGTLQTIPTGLRSECLDDLTPYERAQLRRELGYDDAFADPFEDPTSWDDIDGNTVIDPPLRNRTGNVRGTGGWHRTWLDVERANEFDRLTDQVLVGAWPRDLEAYKREGVAAVVTGCGLEGTHLRWADHGIDHFDNVTGDDGATKPPSWFIEMYRFAEPYLEAGKTVLFHCGAGINRGPSMAYFALRAFHGMSRDEATTLLITKRPICTPSPDMPRYGIAYRDDADAALVLLEEMAS